MGEDLQKCKEIKGSHSRVRTVLYAVARVILLSGGQILSLHLKPSSDFLGHSVKAKPSPETFQS